MIKWLIWMALIPVLILLSLLKWCATYIVQYSGILCTLISRTIVLLVAVGIVTGLGNGAQLARMFVVGLVISFIPWLEIFLISGITFVYTALMNLISN